MLIRALADPALAATRRDRARRRRPVAGRGAPPATSCARSPRRSASPSACASRAFAPTSRTSTARPTSSPCPSTQPDPLPNAALEAAAAGCCVVAADHGGLPEILARRRDRACSSRPATPPRSPPRSRAARRPGARASGSAPRPPPTCARASPRRAARAHAGALRRRRRAAALMGRARPPHPRHDPDQPLLREGALGARARRPRVRGAPPHPDRPPGRGARARAAARRRRCSRRPTASSRESRAILRYADEHLPAPRAAVPGRPARARGGARARGPLRRGARRRGPALAVPRGLQGRQALRAVQPHRRARPGSGAIFPFVLAPAKVVHQPLPRHRRRDRGAARCGSSTRSSTPSRELLADGRRYLVGDRFSAADLAFAALCAPLIVPRRVRHAAAAARRHAARRWPRACARWREHPAGPLRDADVRRAAPRRGRAAQHERCGVGAASRDERRAPTASATAEHGAHAEHERAEMRRRSATSNMR